jgi:hypothetical protein
MVTRGIVRLLTAAAAMVLAATVATPAFAGQPSSGDYYQPPTRYDNRGDFDPECPGLDLTVQFRYRGVNAIRNVRGSNGQAFLASDDYRFREVWVDNSTGDVVITITGAYDFEEVSARRVPKASVPEDLIPPEGLVGPIYLFREVVQGWDVVRDADGKALYRTRGTVVGRNLFDTLGDSQPGGRSLSFETIKVIGPHPLLDVDICDVVAAQLD